MLLKNCLLPARFPWLRAGTDSLTSWTSPKALPADVCSPKTCPAGGCTGLVAGLRRYGRPANKALLDLIQRKQLEEGRCAAHLGGLLLASALHNNHRYRLRW